MWLETLVDWRRRGIPCAMVTIVESEGSTPQGPGAKMVVNDKDDIAGTVGGGGVEHHARRAAIEAIGDRRCRIVRFVLNGDDWAAQDNGVVAVGDCGGTLTMFIEPIIPQKEIVIFGAGHVAERLAKLCDALEQPYRVFDDRSAFATAKRFPGAKERVIAQWDSVAENIALSTRSYCVVMTYGHQYDAEVLEQLIENPIVPYIGMMGSLNKVQTKFEKLKSKGVCIDKRVYSPIGLGFGPNTPEGIALSILSEIQLLMHGGTPAHRRISPFEALVFK